jgi:hypothetical protein
MIDRIFSTVLTFAMLAGGTLAIGSELFAHGPARQVQVVQLPTVTIVAKRLAPPALVARGDSSTTQALR